MTDQPPQKVEKPDAPKGGEKREGYPKLAGGDKPGPSTAAPDKPATGNKAPARLEAPSGGGEKQGGEKPGGGGEKQGGGGEKPGGGREKPGGEKQGGEKQGGEKPGGGGEKQGGGREKPGGEKQGGEKSGYPTLARAESPAASTGKPARPAEASPSAPEKPAPGAGGERSGYPQLANKQPAKESAPASHDRTGQPEARQPEPRQPGPKQAPAESKQPAESKTQPGKEKPPPGPPPPENPPDPSDAYTSRPRPAAPTEAPRTGDGNVDYNAWGGRLKAKGVGGDIDGRVARANNGDKDMAAELRTAERYRDAGYQTSLAPARENAGVRNPDLDAQYHGASPPENQPLKVEAKSRTDGPMTRSQLNGKIDEANAQIKNSNPEKTGRGDIIYDASGARSNMSQAEVEKFVGGKMRGHPSESNARLSQVDYLEVMYRNPDNGALQRTYSVRTPDGRVAGPFTEVFR